MHGSLDNDIEAWEGEGGAASAPQGVAAAVMSATASQLEWAERFKQPAPAEQGYESDAGGDC